LRKSENRKPLGKDKKCWSRKKELGFVIRSMNSQRGGRKKQKKWKKFWGKREWEKR